MPWIWEPSRAWIENTNVWRFMQRLGFSDRERFLRWSRDNPEAFWDEISREIGIDWFRPYHRILDDSRGPEWTRWFERSEEHTSELQSRSDLVCRLLLEKKKK